MSFEAPLGLSTSNHLYAIKVNIVSNNKLESAPKKFLNIIFQHYKRMVYLCSHHYFAEAFNSVESGGFCA
jgi:hypothetical protein